MKRRGEQFETIRKSLLWLTVLAAVCFGFPQTAEAATLTVSPSDGSFVVGNTFSVSIFVDSQDQSINTIGVTLLYPPDRLQLVSPSTGNSIISIWTAVPYVDNESGKITLQGGIPNGIKVKNGLITTLVFRAKAVGSAYIKFADSSRILLNDGKGTDALDQLNSGVFNLTLPPPKGPVVTSPTHPDQESWYKVNSAQFTWDGITRGDTFSYIISDEPIDFPDDIPEGTQTSVEYRGLGDGIHYFHIKELHEGQWGGTTHFAVKIDATAPAAFPIEIIPGARTTRQRPVFQFQTTDNLSGVNHYEIEIVPLSKPGTTDSAQPLFIEASSPYIPSELPLGSYDVVIRAYDNALNFREVSTKLSIVVPLFSFIDAEGILAGGRVAVPWRYFFLALLIVLALLVLVLWKVKQWHDHVHAKTKTKDLTPSVKEQLAELHKYRKKYGLLILILCFSALLAVRQQVLAAPGDLTPPVVTTLSKTITNQEIFYIGGRAEKPSADVVLYIQNLESGETQSKIIHVDSNGNWFYRHDVFLQSGNYRLWLQEKDGAVLSPPSPEQQIMVRTGALQFGVSRISFEALYLLLTVLALLVIIVLTGYISYFTYHARRKHQILRKEIREAEESVKRGFAVLRRDIENELNGISKLRLTKALAAEEKSREDQLREDLSRIESMIGKEIWDIEKAEVQS